MKIDLIGPLPPPYGGISVHLERLHAGLEGLGHQPIHHEPLTHRESLFSGLARYARECRGDLSHFHANTFFEKLWMGAMGRVGRKVLLTVHGQSLEEQAREASALGRWALAGAMRQLDGIVAVNPRIGEFAVRELGVAEERVHVIPAFLPPDEAACRAAHPGEDVQAFLDSHGLVLCANAFHLGDWKGEPLYGADLLVGLLAGLREEFPDSGAILHVAVSEPRHLTARQQLLDEVRARGLDEHFLLVEGSRPFGPTLVRCDVMIRPTVTDGDAISVREGLWMGVPVVASDVVNRPVAAELFASRDVDSLIAATRMVLREREQRSASLRASRGGDPLAGLVAIYQALVAPG